ncbi:MAG: hypothetical protein GX245_07215, partial [Eubacteriaceae bacterium]|nr:hypothetical protein [Eubacteriaceae bacterium]
GKKGGNAVITVTYTDPHGSAFSTSVNVTVKTTVITVPVIVLNPTSTTVNKGDPLPDFTTFIYSVTDGTDGNIPFGNVNIDPSKVKMNQIGTYIVDYSVTNSLGKTGYAYLTVHVVQP